MAVHEKGIDHVADVVIKGAFERGTLLLETDVAQEKQQESLPLDEHGHAAHLEVKVDLTSILRGSYPACALRGPLAAQSHGHRNRRTARGTELARLAPFGILVGVDALDRFPRAKSEQPIAILDDQHVHQNIVDDQDLAMLVEDR
jgi:hypothetical protein